MTVVQLRTERTLGTVLLEIGAAERRWKNHWGDDCESELLDRLDALRSEARTMIEQATGLSWAILEAANL